MKYRRGSIRPIFPAKNKASPAETSTDHKITAEELLKAANESARGLKALFFWYVTALAYAIISVSGVTDDQLLRGSALQLPILIVGIPVVGYFIFLPLVVVAVHIEVMTQFSLLSNKANDLALSLHELEVSGQPGQAADFRLRLENFLLLHFLAGNHRTFMRCLLLLIMLVLLVMLPFFTLILIQVQFLAYNDQAITLWHLALVIVDGALLLYFWPSLFEPSDPSLDALLSLLIKDTLPRTLTACLGIAFLYYVGAAIGLGLYQILWCIALLCSLYIAAGEWIQLSSRAKRAIIKHTQRRWIGRAIFGALNVRPSTRLRGCLRKDRPGLIPTAAALVFAALVFQYFVGSLGHFGWTVSIAGVCEQYRQSRVLSPLTLLNPAIKNVLAQRSSAECEATLASRLNSSEAADDFYYESSQAQAIDIVLLALGQARIVNAPNAFLVRNEFTPELAAKLRTDDESAIKIAEPIDLSDRNLNGAVLYDSVLHKVRLERAQLVGALMDRVHLVQGRLKDAVMPGAQLSSAVLSDSVFDNANLEGAELYDAIVHNARFNRANLKEANLGKAKMNNAEFRDANLQSASLSFAALEGANFEAANLKLADLVGAKLDNASFDKANLSDATLIDAEMRGVDLTYSELVESDLRRANLENATLDTVVMHRSNLEGTDFGNASIRSAEFGGANLDRADFRDAVIRGTSFEGVKATRVNFGGASLTAESDVIDTTDDIVFAGASFEKTNFVGADLSRANLDYAIIIDPRSSPQLPPLSEQDPQKEVQGALTKRTTPTQTVWPAGVADCLLLWAIPPRHNAAQPPCRFMASYDGLNLPTLGLRERLAVAVRAAPPAFWTGYLTENLDVVCVDAEETTDAIGEKIKWLHMWATAIIRDGERGSMAVANALKSSSDLICGRRWLTKSLAASRLVNSNEMRAPTPNHSQALFYDLWLNSLKRAN